MSHPEIARVLQKMISFSEGNIHDIDHLIRVWAYARTIGELEQLDADTQQTLEVAAIVHDIACPLCRIKYGNTHGSNQEKEGPAIARAFLADLDLPEEMVERVCFLVGHHHTYTDIDRDDYQILIEADFIANASENGWNAETIEHFKSKIARTDSGKKMMDAVFSKN